MKRTGILAVVLLGLSAVSDVPAQVHVGAGADFDLGGGRLDLAGADLRLNGAFAVGAGVVERAGTVDLAAAGVLLGESGRIEVLGDWRNGGLFQAGSSLVRFLDQAGAVVEVTGASDFHGLELLGMSGKTYRLQSGQTQRVQSLLRIQGSGATPVQLAGSSVGQAAFLDLAPDGQQEIAHVGVSDVHATGQWLAAGQQNQGGSGNALRWFGAGPAPATPVPVGSLPALLILVALLVLAVRRRLNVPLPLTCCADPARKPSP